MNNKNIVARHLKDLKNKIMGRKDCIIYITFNCAKEIRNLDNYDYIELEEELKARNITIVEEER